MDQQQNKIPQFGLGDTVEHKQKLLKLLNSKCERTRRGRRCSRRQSRDPSKTCGEPTLEQAYPEGLQSMEKTCASTVFERLYPMAGTPCGSMGEMWGGRSGEEELLCTNHKTPSPPTWEGRGGGSRVGKKKWCWAWEKGGTRGKELF